MAVGRIHSNKQNTQPFAKWIAARGYGALQQVRAYALFDHSSLCGAKVD